MAGIIQLRIYPDLILREKAFPVENLDSKLENLVSSMVNLMHENEAVGLAAPQVGVLQRIIIADIGRNLCTLFNPEIIEYYGQDHLEEGCLSLPGIQVEIDRHTTILARGINREGKSIEMEFQGLMARVIQHEIDHLNGILTIDHASHLHRILLQAQLRQYKKDYTHLLKDAGQS